MCYPFFPYTDFFLKVGGEECSSKPSSESLPPSAPLPPILLVEQETVLFLSIKEMYKLVCCTWVYDDSIFFVIPTETACIEVGTSHGTEFPVYHDDLGVMESFGVHPYIATCLHQFVGVIESAVWCQGDITFGREHDFYLYSSFYSLFERFFEVVAQCEVRTDEFDAILGIVDSVHIEIADDILRDMWFAVDDAHHFVIGGS